MATNKVEKLVRTTVMDFLNKYDESLQDPDEDSEFDKLTDQVKFELGDGFIVMRIDGELYELMNHYGFDSEFGFFKNEFPYEFEMALAHAGLSSERWSTDIIHIYKD